jgi:ABC-type multidrug transport system fused ATPase/permease subunit
MSELMNAEDHKKVMLEYCMYDSLRFCFSMLLAIGMVLIGIRLSRNLHADIVGKLLKASFPKFYNVVMTGRLMNRLSKDIYNIDLLMVNELLIAVSFLL